jgi:mRNA interferase HigB
MDVIGHTKLHDFWERHPQAKPPLQQWYQAASSVRWEQFADVRKTYPSVDRIGRCYVFNIAGNKFRLIATIDFPSERIYVREVLTHAEYDRNKWKRHCQ